MASSASRKSRPRGTSSACFAAKGIRPDDPPPIELNRETAQRYRPLLRPFYYSPARYPTYLRQLGVRYPVLPDSGGTCAVRPRPLGER